jgi:hypothetical protein
MAATIDIYTARSQFPTSPTNGTLAVLQSAGRVAELWVYISSGTGWLRAAHGGVTNPGD